jgi:LuxR family maltose regulon positive regulatory protein
MQTGPGNKQLADALFITEGTLKWHLTNIYAKLGVKNRVAAIAAAKDMNLLEGSE